MPLQDITSRRNNSSGSFAGNDGVVKKLEAFDVSRPAGLDLNHGGTGGYSSAPNHPSSFSADSHLAAPTHPFSDPTTGGVAYQPKYSFPTSSGCLPCGSGGSGGNGSYNNDDSNNIIEGDPVDNWESTLLCQPIRLSIEYLQPSDWEDKRSSCLLCRGVSVQAGSEVRHCRGRAHRTAYALLQTLRFTDENERSYLQQHIIDKNGQQVTAWKCLLCDTKSLSHEYMNKHLLGKKHRMIANMELELDDNWNNNTEFMPQGAVPMNQYSLDEYHGDNHGNDRACFYNQAGLMQEQHHSLPEAPLLNYSSIENHADEEELIESLDHLSIRNSDDIARFLGLFSPEKKAATYSTAQEQGSLHPYDSVTTQINFASISPQKGYSSDHPFPSDNAFQPAQGCVSECLSIPPGMAGNQQHPAYVWPALHHHHQPMHFGRESPDRFEQTGLFYEHTQQQAIW